MIEHAFDTTWSLKQYQSLVFRVLMKEWSCTKQRILLNISIIMTTNCTSWMNHYRKQFIHIWSLIATVILWEHLQHCTSLKWCATVDVPFDCTSSSHTFPTVDLLLDSKWSMKKSLQISCRLVWGSG